MVGRKKHRAVRVAKPYDPTPRVLPPQEKVEFDPVEALEMLLDSIKRSDNAKLPPTGRCYDCDRAVSGERKFCGPCIAKHEQGRYR